MTYLVQFLNTGTPKATSCRRLHSNYCGQTYCSHRVVQETIHCCSNDNEQSYSGHLGNLGVNVKVAMLILLMFMYLMKST